jgi:hypothetical protein
MPELRIGSRIDIVFENEIEKINAHYMKAVVYDSESKNIVVSQTSPPLNLYFVNRRVLITYLARSKRLVLRFGFSARLVDLLANYELSSNKVVEALVLKQINEPQQIDYRMHFRVKPPSQSSINLYFQEKKVNLIDVSLGGAKFTYPKSHLFQYGDVLKFNLIIDSRTFEIDTRVRNVSTPEFSINKTIQFVSIKFEYDDNEISSLLGKAILSIERQLLSEGKIN